MRIVALKKMGAHLVIVMALLAVVRPAHAIPAFARKYGLPCSACHEAWPMLNNFGRLSKTTDINWATTATLRFISSRRTGQSCFA